MPAQFAVTGHQKPFGRIAVPAVLGLNDQHAVQALVFGDAPEHRRELQKLVADVKGDDAAWLQMAQIHIHRLRGGQMHRNGIAGKCIHHDQVVALRRLALHRQARIAQHQINLRLTALKEAEMALCNLDHIRIDIVKAHHIALSPVNRERAGTQADHPNAPVRVLQRFNCPTDARVDAVVSGRLVQTVGRLVLFAMDDHAMYQTAHHRFGIVAVHFPHAQAAIEIALHHQHVLRHVSLMRINVVTAKSRRGNRHRRNHHGHPAQNHGDRHQCQHQPNAEFIIRIEQLDRCQTNRQSAQRTAQ